MKATERLRATLKSEIPASLEEALARPLPRALLRSGVARRSARSVLWALDRVDAMASRAEMLKFVRGMLPEERVERWVSRPLEIIRRELRRVAEPGTTPPKQPASKDVEATGKPMPEMIRTTGGKRIPGAVARRAVVRSGDEFKPKKGKK